jgi:hypothetical protein
MYFYFSVVFTNVSDPDSIRSMDPDPDPESGSERTKKMTTKIEEKKLRNFMF